MNDVVILKTADHLDDRINLPDIGEKLISEACSFAGALYKSRDIHELNRCGNDTLGLVHLREDSKALVWHADHSNVRVDRAEGIVFRLRFARACDRVEQSGLSNVGETYDTGFQHEARALAKIWPADHSKLRFR